MGYCGQGIRWTSEKIAALKDLCIQGKSAPEVSEILTERFKQEVSISAVEQTKFRYKLTRHMITKEAETENLEVKIYEDEYISNGNKMVGCDCHSPYFDEIYINRFLAIADKFKISEAVMIGDTLDMDFAKHYYDDETKALDEEIIKSDPLMNALKYFNKVIFLKGNHETRIGRQTDGRVQAHHIFNLFGPELWKEKFKYINRDRVKMGRNWLFVHPRSYSQISGSVAVRLAEKFHRHTINAHGHFIALRYDRSGKYMGIDLGGLFSKEKIKYINETTTTHPFWNPGFGMIYDDHFYHFHEGTDWSYWLK